MANIDFCKKVMHRCFVQKVYGVKTPEKELLSILKGIMTILTDEEKLSRGQQEEVLMSFWDEYNKGCNPPMAEDYIREKLIPAVLLYPYEDKIWAITIIFCARNNL